MKRFFVLLIVLSLVLVAGCASGTVTPEKVDPEQSTEQPQEEPQPQQEIFKIGDTVKMGSLIFTLNSARWDTGDQWISPEANEKWLVLDCTIENTDNKFAVISSIMMFKLYDENNYTRKLQIFADTKGQLDGELGAGRKMSGEIAFSVEKGQTEWEFIFQPQVFGFGQAIFEITEKEITSK